VSTWRPVRALGRSASARKGCKVSLFILFLLFIGAMVVGAGAYRKLTATPCGCHG
jgi:hypothetical protein